VDFFGDIQAENQKHGANTGIVLHSFEGAKGVEGAVPCCVST
jgi:hypothetical protein